jgi:CBS domain-containing protein
MPQRSIRRIIENQRILCAPVNTTVMEAAQLMKQSKFGALLVIDSGRLVGIFTERDALFRVLAERLDPDTTSLADVMTAHPQTISADRPFAHALHLMYEGGFRHVPVIERGRPVGMVSARDALGPELGQFASELQAREHISEILG